MTGAWTWWVGIMGIGMALVVPLVLPVAVVPLRAAVLVAVLVLLAI